MALTTTSFGTTFDLTGTPRVFIFADYTTYSAQGINPADCKCVLKITAPGGAVYYENTNFSNPDINPSVSNLNIIPIQLLIGANGLPVPGQYTFKMTTQVNDGVNPIYTVSSQYNFVYEYVSPVVNINQSVNCVSPLFTSTDETVYTVNGIIPTISRVHSIYFPIGSGLSTLTGTTPVLTRGANQFANGTQTTQITTTLNYAVDNNVNIFDLVTGALEIQVNCEWVCKITCCLTSLNNRMESQRISNYQAFLQTKDIFTQVMSKVTLVMQLISCGKESEVSSVINQIQELANCTDDCCGQDTPSLVTGLGNGNNVNVDVVSGGYPVTVTSTVIGGVTTYSITIDSAFVTKVNNSYNTIVANGGGITWSDSGVVGGIRTFTPSITTPPAQSIAFKIIVEQIGTTVNYSIIDVTTTGTMFQTPTINPWAALPTFLGSANGFIVNNFFTGTPNADYKINATLFTNSVDQGKGTLTGNALFNFATSSLMYTLSMLDHNVGEFRFRLDKFSNIAASNPTIFKEIASDKLHAVINVMITE